jgi:hypothetical protein
MLVSSFATTDEMQGGSNIIPFDDDEIQPLTASDNKEEIKMLFMIHETVLFKDGKGITQVVIYLGSNLSDRVLKHKIRTQNDTEFLVDGILLSSFDTPDIGTVPVLVEQYAAKLQN